MNDVVANGGIITATDKNAEILNLFSAFASEMERPGLKRGLRRFAYDF